jgi:hypothetical protein
MRKEVISKVLVTNVANAALVPLESCALFLPTCPFILAGLLLGLDAPGRWVGGGKALRGCVCSQGCLFSWEWKDGWRSWGLLDSAQATQQEDRGGRLAARQWAVVPPLTGHMEGRSIVGELSLLLLHPF